MSYDIDLYFGQGEFPEKQYQRFLSLCPCVWPGLKMIRHKRTEFEYKFRRESYTLEDQQDLEDESFDWELDVVIYIDLYATADFDVLDDRVNGRKWSISIEDVSGNPELAYAIQLLIPVIGFACFTSCVLEDIQCGLPDLNDRYFWDYATYLTHTKRVLDHWNNNKEYPSAVKHGLLDGDNQLVIPPWLKKELGDAT